MYKIVIITGLLLLDFTWSLAQNNVGVGVTNPQAKLEVWGNGIGYDVFRASNDRVFPLDSGMNLTDLGHLGLGTTNIGNYRLVSQGFPSAFSPQIEVWQGNPNLSGSMLLGDINDVGGGNGSLNLYFNGLTKNVEIRAAGNSYFTGGFMGIGLVSPLEQLHLTGALVLGLHTQTPPNEVAGTIEWDGFNFRGFDGNVWRQLDLQNITDNDWILQVSGYTPPLPNPPPANPELVPMMPPSSISMSFPGDPNQGGIVWIPDRPMPGFYPHQLMLESTSNLVTDASMLFRMSDWSVYQPGLVPPLLIDDYCQGIFRGDMSFKLFRGTLLAQSTQGDAFTMWRSHPSGIFDLPNQSRIRATVTNIDWGSWQLIPPSTLTAVYWTPVNFTNPIAGFVPPVPYPQGMPFWDEHIEFTPAGSPNQPILNDVQGNPIPNAWFTATEEGYYQINARCEFETDEYMEYDTINGTITIQQVYTRANAYVSIAIWFDFAGQWMNFAIGNNLQITNNIPMVPQPPGFEEEVTDKMFNNNAPNVSDIVYLQQGDRIAIYVMHWALTPMMLRGGDNTLYVSIHKLS